MAETAKIVRLRARSGEADALAAVLRDLVGKSGAEAGALASVLHTSASDPELFMVYERWRDAAAFDSHMATPHVAHFLAVADDLLAMPASVDAFDVL
jgi:quinol monooxygenase YgiN